MNIKRIAYLDGLRGIAILWVILFHAFTRWPGIVPYKDKFADVFIFKTGHLGVQLFFLISGFVIFLTLDKCKTFDEYIFKRWARLFPSMLGASLIIFLTQSFFNERPYGQHELISVLPGITFISPSWWSLYLGFDLTYMEGPFWSLFVEFRFYVIAGFVYFYLGRPYLIPCLMVCFLGYYSISLLSELTGYFLLDYLRFLGVQLSLFHFGWFAAGACFYEFYRTERETWFLSAMAIGFAAALSMARMDLFELLCASGIVLLFGYSHKFRILQTHLSGQSLLFVGFISYPLYLIHESMLISGIVKINSVFPGIPDIFLPVFPVFLLMTFAFLIQKYIDDNGRRLLLSLKK
jgi:peptidoglycan/LPS O-acetylase OafA/YrhL